ncbi:high affinity nitrate transporter 2.5-like isoform X1 [Papaver somniferum]|uniref:high affinity nitrate transporter 2.5-like isoform X1 n=1 Tax=Papaver somniferum TaxID=3469 RepID=UPI000E6FF19E|nr:high affinity nitrate transporter 2.5-like isoform X1 [Papaver somniferum]
MEGLIQNETKFSLRVDKDSKATEFRLFSTAPPHMRAFHLAWVSLFACFFSTFAIPPLIPVIRDNLNLTDSDIGNAGIASFCGSIISRLLMGPACDLFGPRLASSALSILTAPIVFATSLASSPRDFILLRFLIGFSIGNFVSNQYWMSSMFSGNVVGLANGFAAGWANVGSGATQLLMPLIYSYITSLGVASFTAWRVAFILPASLQLVTAWMVLYYGQDLPNGNCNHFRKVAEEDDASPKDSFLRILCLGLKNYRGWILALTYGFCFGVELTVDNIIAQYFYDRFNLKIQTAGAIAASFGLANFLARPIGGVISDEMGRRYGIRGRLWSLWVVQTMAGVLCVILGRVNSLSASFMVMCGFSLFVQAASGLTFGVVPFVSKRSLGVIAGMTGSGGTIGAVVTQLLLFSGFTPFSKETGISVMGLMIIICTLPVTLLYFPQSGGMFCGPSMVNSQEDYCSLARGDAEEEQ